MSLSNISHIWAEGINGLQVPRLCSQSDWVELRLDGDPETIASLSSRLLIFLQCFCLFVIIIWEYHPVKKFGDYRVKENFPDRLIIMLKSK